MAKRWTEEEKDFINEYWGVRTTDYIAKKLNRTKYAIIRYAEKNKLGSAYKECYLSTEDISKMFNIDSSTVSKIWIKSYGLKGRKRKLRERKIWCIKADDLYSWCKENQDKWKATYLEEYALGFEDDWLKQKRQRDKDKTVIKSGTSWTMKEIEILKRRVKEGKTSREIGLELNRSKASVDRQRLRSI